MKLYFMIIDLYLLLLPIEPKIEFCKHGLCYNEISCIDKNNLNTKPLFNLQCSSNDSIIDEIYLENEDISYIQVIKNLLSENKIELSDSLKIQMSNFDRFNTDMGFEFVNLNALLNIRLSKLQFYSEKFTNIDQTKCTLDNLDTFLIFKSINSLEFESNVKFYQQVCPLVFVNSDLKYITFNRLTDTFIDRNILTFLSLSDQFHKVTLNSSILSLSITLFEYHLNNDIINDLVFSNLNTLKIKGTVKSLDKSIFSSMKSL